MGKKIKVVGIILIVASVFACLAALLLSTGDIVYSLSEDGTYYVVRTTSDGPVRKKEEVEVREKYNKLPVKGIASGAFNKETINSITLPKTLEAISNYAFNESAYYNDEASWEITYLEDKDGNVIGGELYRALYISNYLIEVIYNDELVSKDGGILPTFVVKDGTLGIAEGAFKSNNPEAKYTAVSVKIESDDLSFVGTGIEHYADENECSKEMFDIRCDSYIVFYDGTKSDWLEFDHEGIHTDYTIYCQDGVIDDLTEEES